MNSKNLKVVCVLITFILVISFILSGTVGAADNIRLSVSASPSSLPAFYVQDNVDSIELDVSIHRSRNIVISRLMQGEVDAALLSTNEAAKLYNRDVAVQLLGIHNWGLFYLLSSNPELENWDDLRGEEIYVPDKGGPLDIVFQELSAKNNIDFKTDFSVERGKMREIAQLMINNMAETAVIREPFVSQTLLNNPDSRIIFDLQQEWEKEYDFRIAQSALVVRREFANNNKDLISKLEAEYIEAVKKLASNHELASELGQKHLEVSPEVTLKAYPSLNLDYQNISEVKDEVIAYFEVLKAHNEQTIGGRLPDEEFYFSY